MWQIQVWGTVHIKQYKKFIICQHIHTVGQKYKVPGIFKRAHFLKKITKTSSAKICLHFVQYGDLAVPATDLNHSSCAGKRRSHPSPSRSKSPQYRHAVANLKVPIIRLTTVFQGLGNYTLYIPPPFIVINETVHHFSIVTRCYNFPSLRKCSFATMNKFKDVLAFLPSSITDTGGTAGNCLETSSCMLPTCPGVSFLISLSFNQSIHPSIYLSIYLSLFRIAYITFLFFRRILLKLNY